MHNYRYINSCDNTEEFDKSYIHNTSCFHFLSADLSMQSWLLFLFTFGLYTIVYLTAMELFFSVAQCHRKFSKNFRDVNCLLRNGPNLLVGLPNCFINVLP